MHELVWVFMGKSPRREVVRSSAGACVVYPPFGGRSRSIPQGMILDVQPRCTAEGNRIVCIVCLQTVGKQIFWLGRVGQLSPCSEVLLHLLGVVPMLTLACFTSHLSHDNEVSSVLSTMDVRNFSKGQGSGSRNVPHPWCAAFSRTLLSGKRKGGLAWSGKKAVLSLVHEGSNLSNLGNLPRAIFRSLVATTMV